jgi:hypothetical protein
MGNPDAATAKTFGQALNAGRKAASDGKYDEAIASFNKAVSSTRLPLARSARKAGRRSRRAR